MMLCGTVQCRGHSTPVFGRFEWFPAIFIKRIHHRIDFYHKTILDEKMCFWWFLIIFDQFLIKICQLWGIFLEIFSFGTEKMLYLGAQMKLADSPQHNLRRGIYYEPLENISTRPEYRQMCLSKNITFFCTKCFKSYHNWTQVHGSSV